MLSFLDFSGLPDVESSDLDLIEWKDGSGIARKVKIYSSIGLHRIVLDVYRGTPS